MLKFHAEDNGFCRVYFKLDTLLYCWQESARGEFEFLRCSRDGEPDYVVKRFIKPDRTPAEMTPDFEATTETGRLLRKFLGK